MLGDMLHLKFVSFHWRVVIFRWQHRCQHGHVGLFRQMFRKPSVIFRTPNEIKEKHVDFDVADLLPMLPWFGGLSMATDELPHGHGLGLAMAMAEFIYFLAWVTRSQRLSVFSTTDTK